MFRLPRPHLPVRRFTRRDDSSTERDEVVLNRGQIIVLFAGALLFFIGIMGLAIDMSYLWVNEMRMQKAADGAALAGAVYLPDDPAQAHDAAIAMATRNGYSASGTVAIDAQRNSGNHEQMDVTITARVPTFFMRAFGVNSLAPARTAHAQFHLPVPMGSPLNVFGDPTATDLQGNPLNFWAAIQGPCTKKENGDPYATKQTTTVANNCAAAGVSNGEYKYPAGGDPGTYDYAVKVTTPGTLTIQLYDPEYCWRKTQGQDTGDTYFSDANSKWDTTFRLYAPSDTPYDLADDAVVASVTYPGNQLPTPSSAANSCSSYYVTGNSHDNYVGKWITFASAGAGVGTYRLNIQTTPVGTSSADGSNHFGIRATLNGGNSGVSVFAGVVGAESAMSIYNNVPTGTSYIYLAQLNSAVAGKTMEVDLFDPGDLNGTGVMSFMMPTGSGYTPATFSWRDSGTSLGNMGTPTANVTSVTTCSGGTSRFQGHWLVVTIRVPVTYTAPQNGWWKIRYVITGGAAHDRTTWRVQIKDAPVHLVQ